MHRLRISEVRLILPGFCLISFESHPFQYEAGQYITLVRFERELEVRRAYSIVSAPLFNEPLQIGVKRVENGMMSRWLVDDARPGDEAVSVGAGGLFTLPRSLDGIKELVFFAAGSGITPVISLIRTALATNARMAITLIYSNRSVATTLFTDTLDSLQAAHPNRLKVRYLFSDAFRANEARLSREMIMGIVSACGVDGVLYYICGPELYNRLCVFTLRSAGVPGAQIRKENFVIPDRQIPVLPPRTDVHTIDLLGTGRSFKAYFPDSILQNAKRSGIMLPYSCASGRCGSCALRCVKGKVWHSNNEVLTEEDLAKGLILTCTGHALSDLVLMPIDPKL